MKDKKKEDNGKEARETYAGGRKRTRKIR